MNHRLLLLVSAALVAGVTGCCGTGAGSCNGYNQGPGWFGAVNGARIAPPATGAVQYPQQVANLPDPYYGRTPTTAAPQGNVNQGWRPANPAPGFTNPINYNPGASNTQVPRNTIPANNMVVSSSTSGIQPRATNPATTNSAVAISTTGVRTPTVASTSVNGGMPLNDATRVATAPIQNPSNTGILNRTWEYVARPNTTYGQNGSQYIAKPVYANGTVVASNSTSPGFQGPRPTSYANQNRPGYINGYVNGVNGYQGGYPGQQNGVIAGGWRQRDVAR